MTSLLSGLAVVAETLVVVGAWLVMCLLLTGWLGAGRSRWRRQVRSVVDPTTEQ